MEWFKKLRIAHKIAFTLVAVLFLFSVSVGVILWKSMGNVMRDSLVAKGEDLGAQLAALSSEPIQTANLYALHELIHLTKTNNKEVRYVLIVDEHGYVMVNTFTQGIPKNLLKFHDVSQKRLEEPDVVEILTDEGSVHDILYPIEQGELGYVRIGMHEKTIKQVLYANLSQLIIATIIVGVVSILIAIKLTQLFTRPLKRLTKISEAISCGVLPEQTVVSSGDEIGQLTVTINTMTASLKRNEAERQNLLSSLITAQEDERRRISRELHDETSQALTALILSMRAMANQAADSDQKSFILAVRDEAVGVLHKLRNLAIELRPPALDDLGLAAAVEKYINDYHDRYGIDINFSQNLDKPILENKVGLAIYRILQESMTNVIKHSGATRVSVLLNKDDSNIILFVKDNGVGLTQDRLLQARGENRLGLYGIQERVEILGGKLEVLDELPEWSTVIKVTLPY